LILTFGILLLPACGKSNQDGNNGQNFNDNGSDTSNNFPGGFMRNNPDLYGEVKTINGNKLTVSVLEMSQRSQNLMTDEERRQMMERRANDNQNSNGAPDPNVTRRPQGGGFMGGEKKYTGETVDLELTDGVPITTFDIGNRGNWGNRGNGNNGNNRNNRNNDSSVNNNNGNNGDNGGNVGNGGNRGVGNFQEKQLSLSDIKVGSVIQVWYDKDSGDKKEIQSIRVLQLPGGSNNQQNDNQQNNNQQNDNQQNKSQADIG
jgi:hypothetical protein